MKYLTAIETAKKMNLSERSIRNYCSMGKIPGAKLVGKTWYIPENATKPSRASSKEEIDYSSELVDFLFKSPVNFYVIKNAKEKLLECGYKEISENSKTKIKTGEKVFFVRNGTSLVALNIGSDIKEDSYPFHIIASHSDSPCFKIKPVGDSKSDIYNKINVEIYGGSILSTWLDRPLSIAGRVFIDEGNGVTSKLINIDKDLLLIPNMCIHFNRDVNNGYSYNPMKDMQPFIAQSLEGDVLKNILKENLKVKENQIVSYDLFVYNREYPSIWGANNEYISSGRLDDLECVFTSLTAFTNSNNPNAINVLYIADNEEVGSMSSTGADGDFLERVLRKVAESLGYSNDSFSVALANSFLVSADNAHAVHPNDVGMTDANNKAYMNQGIAIKFNASQKYTSDGLSTAIFTKLCDLSGAKYQYFANRSDIRGGSTLGNILLSHLSIKAVDVGLPQLAMHSSFETAGVKDVGHAVKVFKTLYSKNIVFNDNGFEVN